METFEKNNPTIALNILYIKEKTQMKQIILLMIPNDEKEDWHYLAVKKLYPLLHGITFKTENKLKSHEKVCKNKDLCGIVMPSKKNYILEFNQYMKSDKM